MTDAVGNVVVVPPEVSVVIVFAWVLLKYSQDLQISAGTAFIVSSLADEETTRAIENADNEERDFNGSIVGANNDISMEDAYSSKEGTFDNSRDEYNDRVGDVLLEDTDGEDGDDDDENRSQEALDTAVDIHDAHEQSQGSSVVLRSPAQAIDTEQKGGSLRRSECQPLGIEGLRVSEYQPPDATQTGGSLVGDFIPSFSTFIVCYCAVLATLILSSADSG